MTQSLLEERLCVCVLCHTQVANMYKTSVMKGTEVPNPRRSGACDCTKHFPRKSLKILTFIRR